MDYAELDYLERRERIGAVLREAIAPFPLEESEADLVLITEAIARLEKRGDIVALQGLSVQIAGAAQRVTHRLISRR